MSALRVVLLFVLVVAGTVGTPASALGHPAPQTAADHSAEDSVVHSTSSEAGLARSTATATGSDAALAAAAVAGDEHVVGQWGPVVDWPVVGVHVALMPNGKVLAYDSVGDRATEAFPVHDHTRATMWDPATGAHTPVNVDTGFNVFCSGMAHLSDGSLFVAGGNKNSSLEGIRQTHVFNAATNRWTRGADMAHERWYPSVTPLRDGEMLITEGGPDTPEVRTTAGSHRTLPGATLDLPLYPWLDVAPDGRAFYSGPSQTMRSLNPAGAGTWQTFGQRDSIDRSYGSHAMFDIGKLLVAGGGASSKDSRVIDVNGASPQVSATAPMANGRRQHNLTLLADGSALATGGNSSGAGLVDLANGVYAAELWSPASGQWRTLAAQRVTRQYHSTALLLPDGRVLSSGGGICGTCDSVGYLAKNAEVFTPPYLFKQDGSGTLAPRPSITSAPAEVNYGAPITVSTPNPASIRKVGLVRLGAVTHSVDMEQRYVPLSFSSGGGALTASGPANANIAPPGPYMLFVVDDAGVPSVARMVTVAPGPPADTVAPSVSLTAPAAGASVSGTANVAASASDNVAVSGVQFKLDGQDLGGEDTAAPYAAAWNTTTASNGSHNLSAVARDAAGNRTSSATVTVNVQNATAPPGGLVAAYSFNEGSGTLVTDASTSRNSGTVSGASWIGSGKNGGALSFDGVDDWVTVPDAPSLDLAREMTLEAWVKPTTLGGWRSVMIKETPTYLSYGLYAASSNANRPAAEANRSELLATNALAAGAWTHLAVSYDGTTMRLYLNGTQAATRATSVLMPDSANPLRIGGNQIWGEYLHGALDDIRIYNRALTPTQIQTDMNTAVPLGTP